MLQNVAFGWSPSSDNGSGLASYQFLIDGQVRNTVPANTVSIPSLSIPGAYSYLAPGAHTWTVVAIDLAGNSETTTPRTIQMDSQPPQFGSGQVTVDAYMNSTALLPLATTFSFSAGSAVVITATASWCYGNCSNPNSFYGPDGLSGDPRRTNGCQLGTLVGRFGSGPWLCLGSNTMLTSPGGQLILAFNDTNYSDNSGTAQVNIGTIVGGLPLPNTWIADRTPTFSWTLSSDTGGSGVVTQTLAVDGTSTLYSGLSSTINVSTIPTADALADGWHDWHVIAIDKAGNQGLTAVQIFGVDTTGPVGLQLSATNGTADGAIVSNPTPNLCWTVPSDAGSGPEGYRLYIDGALSRDNIPLSPSCSTPNAPLGEGNHTWYAEAFDKLGNATRSLETWTLTNDISPPAAFALIAPINDVTIADPHPNFSWQASSDLVSGLDHYEVWIDSDAGGQCAPCVVSDSQTSFAPLLGLSVGSHTWYVKAVDRAANETKSTIGNFGVAATPTATSTGTHTPTLIPTPSATATRTSTATSTRTATPSSPPTRTATITNTMTPIATATSSKTPTHSATLIPSPTATSTRTGTPTSIDTRTPTPTATGAATATFASTATESPTLLPTALDTQTPTHTPEATVAATVTTSATPSPTLAASATPSVTALVTHGTKCVGDCDNNGKVSVDELVHGVNIALSHATLDQCPEFDCNGNERVTVDCLVRAVNAALNGCAG